ncbi:glycosyltransferase family 2 protein [Patescibacteria group bacterium]|nr:glycosyltransferase family 2 protein [Patescibacteria group bacterium]MBU1886045.1 glycosyltransferase family 2 protein [Patescibacteria group bacterium]
MISVVLATHNEEQNIKRCLESVKDFADEIIIVDGSSTDKTREKARKLGAKVIKTTNKSNFHINKQMAMDRAKGDLVLQLDADEVVDGVLQKFIKNTHLQILKRKNHRKKAVAWWLKRKNLFMGQFFKKTGQYPDPVIRLYVNGYAKLPQKDIHEQMIVSGSTAWAEGHLIHYANPSFKDYMRKWNIYTSFKAQQLLINKTKINFINSIKYLVWLPSKTFVLLFIRHKGFVDKVPGFVFSVMSGLHHAMAYLKLWGLCQEKNN